MNLKSLGDRLLEAGAPVLKSVFNGYKAKPTALVRAMGAVTGIGLFSAITLGLVFSWTWPPGLAVYSVLAVFGGFSLYWSIFDVAAIPAGHDDDTT